MRGRNGCQVSSFLGTCGDQEPLGKRCIMGVSRDLHRARAPFPRFTKFPSTYSELAQDQMGVRAGGAASGSQKRKRRMGISCRVATVLQLAPGSKAAANIGLEIE